MDIFTHFLIGIMISISLKVTSDLAANRILKEFDIFIARKRDRIEKKRQLEKKNI
jgi:hypothetical protein